MILKSKSFSRSDPELSGGIKGFNPRTLVRMRKLYLHFSTSIALLRGSSLNMMNTSGFKIITVLFLTVLSFLSFSQEFEVVSFKQDPLDATAVQQSERDINGQVCALIKVRTELKDISIVPSSTAVKLDYKLGDYYVYVSPGERRISFWKDEYRKLEYVIQIQVETAKVYILELTRKGGYIDANKGTIIIETEPSGAKISLEGLNEISQLTPVQLNNILSAYYPAIITKERYEIIDTIVKVNENDTILYNFQFKPKWGNLKVNTNITGADFYLDGSIVSKDSIFMMGEVNGPDVGKHSIEVKMENYFPQTKVVDIFPGDTTELFVDIEPITGSVYIYTVPTGSSVYSNDIEVGKTPFIADSLIIGKHLFRLENENYLTIIDSFNLQQNDSLVIERTLRNYKFVRIESSPKNARVTVNGKVIGKTGVEVRLPVGENIVELEKNDYQTIVDTVQIIPDKELYHYDLQLKEYGISISSKPSGADVYINKISEGNTPYENTLQNGNHKVLLKKENHYNLKRSFSIENEAVQKTYRLRREIKAYFNVYYMPDTARYNLDCFGADRNTVFFQL